MRLRFYIQGENKNMENFYEGILSGNSKGFGFLAVEGMDDFFIPPTRMKGALDGDKVVVRPIPDKDRNNLAEVVKILEYANQQIIGDLSYGMMGNYVIPDNPKLHKVALIKPADLHNANVGDKVIVKITAQPSNDDNLLGEVIEVLGQGSDRSVMEKAILKTNKLPQEFPESVLNFTATIPQEVSAKDKKGRVDLTKEIIFTIDGDDSKDLDDAISIKKLDNGNFYLGVHIADVGNYVRKDNPIDIEAYKRGTSAYFPGYVIPMLPTALSNGICSLNEGVERLALSCEMEVTPQGKVVDHKIFESVIKSVARLTYTKVFNTLQGTEKDEKYLKLADKFKLMESLCLILEKKKIENGYLELAIPEAHFILNEKGEILEIEKYEVTIAHRIIESFMVLCNEVVAEHFHKLKIPFVYRVHETPPQEKVQNLVGFVESLGISVRFGDPITPKDYQNILNAGQGKPYEEVLNKVLLISLAKARYYEKCLGHFGLASVYYTHFTSPIRRYSDLTIHRIIKDYLHGNTPKTAEKIDELKQFVSQASEQSSITEKRAEVSERQVNALKMAEYMQKHIGEVFEGKVNGVSNFGIFVELDSTIEGLIRIENLPDDEYEYLEKSMTLKGHKHSYSFGSKITIRVAGVDLNKRQVDFCEANTEFKPKTQRSKLEPRQPRSVFNLPTQNNSQNKKYI